MPVLKMRWMDLGGRLLCAAALISVPLRVTGGPGNEMPPPPTVVGLITKDLVGDSTKEVVMLTVTYPGAGASLPHRHDAQVFVYVLEGELTMQVRGKPAVHLGPGQTFYEAPDDVHIVSANASDAAAAKMLVVMIKDKGKPASRSAVN